MALEYSLVVKDNGSLVLKKASENAEYLRGKFNQADKQTNIFGNTINATCKKTSIFNNTLHATSQTTNIFGKSLSFAGTAAANMVGIGLAKGVGMLMDFGKEMVQSHKSATSLAESVGGTAESIVGLRYAADMAGVGAKAMDANLVKLSKSIGDANSGGKQAAGAFAKMGIEVKKSDGTLKNSQEVMLEMADAFKNLPAGTERATLAMDVFGKSGANMVNVLKDGSASLKQMMDDGSASVGNIENISKGMEKLSQAGTQTKTALMGVMAELANSELFEKSIDYVKTLAGQFASLVKDFNNWDKISGSVKEAERSLVLADMQIAQQQKQKIMLSEEYAKAGFKQKEEMVKAIDAEIKAMKKKNKISEEEYEQTMLTGVIQAYNIKESMQGLSEQEAGFHNFYLNRKEEREALNALGRVEKDEAEEAKKAAAAAQAKAEEAARKKKAAEDMAMNNFKANMKSKEDAIKSLADLDEKMNIRFLDGEEKKIAEINASYKKQAEEIKTLQEKELFNVGKNSAAKEEIITKHNKRIEDLEKLKEQEIQNIKDEFTKKDAKAREAASKSIAEIDEKNKMHFLELETKKLDGFKASHEEQKAYIAALENQKQAELDANYEKQLANITKLHEQELIGLEEHSLTKMEIEAAHTDRLAEMNKLHQADKDAVKKKYHDEEVKRLKDIRDKNLEAATANLQAMQQVCEGQKQYAGLYKTAAIAEATVNATQSVLKTMAGTPYPFNIPLATMQATLAAMQVNKIASTNMYAGGMIKGGRQLIQVNEEGNEAILNTGAVRAVGGPEGVKELNSGHSYNTNNNNYNNSQSVNITLNSTLVSQEEWRRIEQVRRWSEKRK
jgi:hypothetical protein